MYRRAICERLLSLAKQYPVLLVTGPRHSGKTTLVKQQFSDYHYVNLESLENRRLALEDPKGFLEQIGRPVVLDEVHRAPDLLSYIQVQVDDEQLPGQYILTGSQHLN